MNFPTGDNRAAGVTLALSSSGNLYAVYKASSGKTTHIIFDVTGYFLADDSGDRFKALATPARILDTSTGLGLSGKFTAGTPRTLTVAGVAGIPSNATAVTGTIHAKNANYGGWLYAGPTGLSSPPTSSINFPTNDTRSNGITVMLGSGGTIGITYGAPSGKTTDVIFDVTGYFVHDSSGAAFVPNTPTRILDTRYGIGLSGKFNPGSPRTMDLANVGLVAWNAVGITGTLTVVYATAGTSLYFGPEPLQIPAITTSTLDFPASDTRSSGVALGLSAIDGAGIGDVITTYSYDSRGRVVTTVSDAGFTDATSTSTYDLTGNVVTTMAWPDSGGTGTARTTTSHFNSAGKAAGTQAPIAPSGSPAPLCPDSTSQRCNSVTVSDFAGRTVETIDAYGVRTHTWYDLGGKAVRTISNYVAGSGFTSSQKSDDRHGVRRRRSASRGLQLPDPVQRDGELRGSIQRACGLRSDDQHEL